MEELVQLGRGLQAVGTDCVVMDAADLVLPPASLDSGGLHEQLLAIVDARGDIGSALHIPCDGEWLRVEPLAEQGGAWLVALLPRTCQHVVREAQRLQGRRDALQELAGSTAREMNDAMTIVQGRLELLMAFGLKNPESAARHASIALEHSERITSALHNLRLVGSGGMLRFKGLDLEAAVARALAATIDEPDGVQLDISPKGLRIVGHEPAVDGVLAGVLRAVVGDGGGTVRVRVAGDQVNIGFCSKASRHAEMDSLPLGIVSALLDAMGGSLSFASSCVVVTLPRELRELGIVPRGKAVLAVGQPAFTQAVRSFLEPSTMVRTARSAEAADLDAPDLFGVVAELLLPGRSGLAMLRRLQQARPDVTTLLVTHDEVASLPPDLVPTLAGPLDRARLLRALTGNL